MFPKIVVSVPWWVWLLLIVCIVGFVAYALCSEPSPQPSVMNIVRHLLSVWAKDAQGMYQRYRHPDVSQRARYETSDPISSETPVVGSSTSSTSGFESKGERACRLYMEERFGTPFQKARPSFLKNPVTGENLEIDIFNQDLRLGVEYNGRQHYHFTSHFHRNSNDRFQNQQYRDLIKKQLCQENGVTLIIVPYWVKESEIPDFLEKELVENGF